MFKRFALILGAIVLAALGVNYWFHSKKVDIDQIKRQALQLRQQGNLEAFVAVLDNVPADSPDKARAYLEQARAYWELTRGPAMERALEKCIALERNKVLPTEETLGAWGTMGDHYVGQERFEEAIDVIWKVFDARSRRGQVDAFYLILLLRLHFESAEPAVAIDLLRHFIASDPDDFDSHRSLGVYLTRVGELEDARQHLKLAVQARPDVPRFLDSWLSYLFHVNEIDTAQSVLEQLPKECDNRPEFWVYRGKAADYRGDFVMAVTCFSKAVELEPSRMDANNLLAQAQRKAGTRVEAEERVKLCQKFGTAFRELSGIYAVLRSQQPGTTPDSSTCHQITELCDQLGWDREAQGWAKLNDTLAIRK